MKKAALYFEQFVPICLGAVAAVAFVAIRGDKVPAETPKELLGAGVSIGAIAVGFLANSKAILFSIDRKRIIEQLRDTNYYNYLVTYLMSAINWSLALAILSAVGLTIDLRIPQRWHAWGVAAWLWIAVTSISTYYRVINIFARILRSGNG